MDAESFNQWAGGFQSFAAVVALLVGGTWTFLLFVKNRLSRPCGLTTHNVTTELLSGHGLLVHVGLQVKNESAVLMKLISGQVQLVPVLPLSDSAVTALGPAQQVTRDRTSEPEVQWPGIRSYEIDWSDCPREIEPRESDTFHFDFVVDSDLEVFQVYSYLKNETKRKREIGWSTTTFHRCEED